jgi:hypothetical protein
MAAQTVLRLTVPTFPIAPPQCFPHQSY